MASVDFLVSQPTAFASPIDRYFTRLYSIDTMKKPLEDHCVLRHSNGVCVLTLAPTHPVYRSQLKSIEFRVTEKVDRSQNALSGKAKHGAQRLMPDSPICRLNCDEGSFTVRACIKGKLIEVNDRLSTDPSLLINHPESIGYLCVMVPQRIAGGDGSKDGLISDEAYHQARTPKLEPMIVD